MTVREKAMKIRGEFKSVNLRKIAKSNTYLQLLAEARAWGVRVAILSVSAALCLGFSGCGGSSLKPQVGSITVTDMNGAAQTAIKTLGVGRGTYLDVTLTNDKNLMGVDWTVTCGSSLAPGTPLPTGQTVDTSCGYFTPIHTASAPVPSYSESAAGIVTYYVAPAVPPKAGTVTLYASSSADHSRFSALPLVIAGDPISVAIVASTAPPFTLASGETMSITGTLSNDYTVGGGSLSWSLSCGSSNCGLLSSIKTTSGTAVSYTAPATKPSGSTVTVRATSVTDSAESNSILIAIT